MTASAVAAGFDEALSKIGWLESVSIQDDDTAALYDELKAMVMRLRDSGHCQAMWRSLAARTADGQEWSFDLEGEEGEPVVDQSFGAWCLEQLRDYDRMPQILEAFSAGPGRSLSDAVIWLSARALWLMEAPAPEHLRAARSARARKVERLVNQLIEAMEPVWAGMEQHEYPNHRALVELADGIVGDGSPYSLTRGGAEKVPRITSEESAVARLACRMLLHEHATVLIGYARDVEEWAGAPLDVTQVNAANARRLLFIRGMTRAFRSAWGQPMRSAVSALSLELFPEAGDMDEATLAKLAP